MENDIYYQNGFGNYFESEAASNTLPKHRNSPQQCASGLYAEQLSGTSFLAPTHENQKTWLYKMRPSVTHGNYHPYPHESLHSAPVTTPAPPDQFRWDPMPAGKKQHFIDSLFTICAAGSVSSQSGIGIHLYHARESMEGCCFYNADGDFLIVPQSGRLLIKTEMGRLQVSPGEISVVQRGIKFQVLLLDDHARGYVCENYGSHFVLPYRGPIGANGLANERDFEAPVAYYENSNAPMQMLAKFEGSMWTTKTHGSVFDVVAWHGNYVPYKYNLAHFNTINTVSFDHPDPSIFTVLTSPSTKPGTSNIDFVIFPPRWMVARDTFRPPYYHRNVMSEYMGLIHGVYDAKPKGGGFCPGGGSLHNCMTAHGPDSEAFTAASKADLKPEYYDNTLAFMFETCMALRPTEQALTASFLQKDYIEDSWGELKNNYTT